MSKKKKKLPKVTGRMIYMESKLTVVGFLSKIKLFQVGAPRFEGSTTKDKLL